MSIKWVSVGVFASILGAAIGVGVLAQLSSQAAVRLYGASEQRYASFLLADELRQSSDELTRLARTYVVTGDDAFERDYWHLLAVRNGEAPREDGRVVALRSLMKEAGFTDDELALLAESQANSDGLVTTETVAMNAVKGLFDDGEGRYVKQGPPDPEMAIRIMHDAAYHADKSRIIEPIDRFERRLDARTGAHVALSMQDSERLNLLLRVLVGILLVIAPVGAWVTYRHIVRPVILLQQQIDRLSRGDLRVDSDVRQVAGAAGEMARLAQAVVLMSQYSTQMAETARQLAAGNLTLHIADRSAEDELSQSFRHLAHQLQRDLTRFRQESGHLNHSAAELSDVATRASSGIGEVSERATTVAAAAQQTSETMVGVRESSRAASERIHSVAASTEQMTATISEIAQNAESTRHVTETAVDAVGSASGRVAVLGEAADRIGEVLTAIVDIAEQTKLLALNATIEAASAGEAGKGFAVVANEVKELARQTAEATAEIRTSIEAIQVTSSSTVEDIGNIQGVIAKVDENVSSIATAVEEQAVTTRDIAVHVQQAAQSVEDVSSRVDDVTTATTSIASDIGAVDEAGRLMHNMVNQVEERACDLKRLGGELRRIVDAYDVGVVADTTEEEAS